LAKKKRQSDRTGCNVNESLSVADWSSTHQSCQYVTEKKNIITQPNLT